MNHRGCYESTRVLSTAWLRWTGMSHPEIVETIELYPALDEKLIELLEGLSTEEWNAPSMVWKRTVKDVAAHILDGCYLRRLSIHRDGYFGEKPEGVDSYWDLVAFLNGLNATWVGLRPSPPAAGSCGGTPTMTAMCFSLASASTAL